MSGKRTGKNITYFSDGILTNAGITFTFADGVITANGTATNIALQGNVALYLEAGTYRVFNLAPQTTGCYVTVQNSEGSTAWPTIASTSGAYTDTFTLDRRTKVAVRARIQRGTTVTDLVFKPMIVVGTDEPTEFEPYTGQNISVNWQDTAGTVYGGTLDVISGLLTIDKRNVVVDGKRTLFNVVARTNTVRFAVAASPAMAGGVRESINVISDKLPSKPITFKDDDILGVCGWRSSASEKPGLWMSIPIEAGSTDTSIKEWLHANPITCVYPLRDPVTYQLTPQEVTTLLGTNVIWANTGDVTVTYIAKSAKFSFGSPLHIYNYNNLKLFGNTYIEHGKG